MKRICLLPHRDFV